MIYSRSGSGRTGVFRTIITFGLAASLAYAASERETAEWVLRWEGRVTLDGSRQAVSDLSQLPEGDFHITGIDLTGAVMEPVELR